MPERPKESARSKESEGSFVDDVTYEDLIAGNPLYTTAVGQARRLAIEEDRSYAVYETIRAYHVRSVAAGRRWKATLRTLLTAGGRVIE